MRSCGLRLGHGVAEPASRNPAIEMKSQLTRYLRVDIDSKGGGAGRQAPVLELSWPPEQIYFLDQGGGPRTLVYGKLDAPAARFDARELLAIGGGAANREAPVWPTATLGPRVELRGRAALEPEIEPGPGLPVQTIVLWVVLLGSVTIVGGMALRLAREMRE